MLSATEQASVDVSIAKIVAILNQQPLPFTKKFRAFDSTS
jgi:hypothetical protein